MMISDVLFSRKPAKFQAEKLVPLKIKVCVTNKILMVKVAKSCAISKLTGMV